MSVEWQVTLTAAGRSSWLLNERGTKLMFGTEVINQQSVSHWPKLKALPIQFSTHQIAQASWYALEAETLGSLFIIII